MTHLTLQEWIKYTNYPYDENDHLTAEEDYGEFCFQNGFWAIID